MRWLIGIVVTLIAVIGVVALIGFFLPVSHEASRSADFNAPPDAVWALIADPNSYGGWWSDHTVRTEVVERTPPSRLVTQSSAIG